MKKHKKYWKYSSRGREVGWVGEDPESLPEPEHLNQLQIPYDLATDPLPFLLMLYNNWQFSYCAISRRCTEH